MALVGKSTVKMGQNHGNFNDSSSSTADPGQGNPPSNNLWIGNVSSEVSESELKALFEKHGKVDSVTLYPGRNYAFLYFNEIEAAKDAKQRLQGYVLRGIPLKIEFAKSAKPCKSLWVAGVNQSVSKEDLEKEFSKFGTIQEFRFLRDRSIAYVNYIRLEDAAQALKSMNGKQIGGDQIRVDFLRSHASKREPGVDAKEGPLGIRNMGPPDLRWMAQDSMQNYTEPNLTGSMRDHQFLPPGARPGDFQLTKVLWISHPPSVILEEEMLHNAMILFGEIEWIKILPDRHCAFVAFRSIEEARRAKEGLEGKLFNDPRILIDYSRSEPLPGKNYISHYPGMKEHVHDLPFRPVQMDILSHNLPIMANTNPGHLASLGIRGPDLYTRPLGPHPTFDPALQHREFVDKAEIHKLQNPSPHALIGGPNWRRSSPTPGLIPSPSAVPKPSNRSSSDSWDAFDAIQERELKRSRVDIPFSAYDTSFPRRSEDRVGSDDQHVMGKVGTGAVSGSLGRVTTSGLGKRQTESDYIWRGIIAKGGSPVCHARCVPIGEWVGSKIPEVINCSARTGLDMLSKHYDDAIGFNIVFFLPDSEEDFASYTEFLRYLGTKDRAGVAKFDDGTTLFLVPPSNFLTKVLKVNGPKRLYGVVLKFPQVETGISSINSQALQSPHVDTKQMTSLHAGYNVMPPEKRVVEKEYPRGFHEDSEVPPNTSILPTSNSFPARPVPPINNTSVASSTGVALTPELIATLASFLPANNRSYSDIASPPITSSKPGGSTLKVTSLHDTEMSRWAPEHRPLEQTGHLMQQLGSQFSSQSQHMPQPQSLSAVSNMQNNFHQGMVDYSQMHGGNMNFPPQGTVSSRPMTSMHPSQTGSALAVPEVDLQYQPGSSQNALMGGRVDHGADSLRFYNPSAVQQLQYPVPLSNQNQDTGVSQPHVMPHSSQVEHTNKGQQLQSAPYGVGQESAESEADKNERYKTTLLFAANLLARIHQQPGNQAGSDAGGQ